MSEIELLSAVAVLRDFPAHGLKRGQVGTVVEMLDPSAVLVEFCDDQGHTYAMVPLMTEDLMRLHSSPLEQVA